MRLKLDKLLALDFQTKKWWEIDKKNIWEMIKSGIKSPLDLKGAL